MRPYAFVRNARRLTLLRTSRGSRTLMRCDLSLSNRRRDGPPPRTAERLRKRRYRGRRHNFTTRQTNAASPLAVAGRSEDHTTFRTTAFALYANRRVPRASRASDAAMLPRAALPPFHPALR